MNLKNQRVIRLNQERMSIMQVFQVNNFSFNHIDAMDFEEQNEVPLVLPPKISHHNRGHSEITEPAKPIV